VIAAGGITDGRGLAAALALGVDAVWCGTRFLASQEANVHTEYKRRVVAASVDDTVRTTLFAAEWPGQLMGVVRNGAVREWLGREAQAMESGPGAKPIGHTRVGGQTVPIPKFSMILPTPDTDGDFEEMGLTMGESAGLIGNIKPAANIVREMGHDADRIFEAGRIRAH
jgi:NAD(P)H-dependent flavin oxidoreductase YrpB (nitropropane dioxygenase family)